MEDRPLITTIIPTYRRPQRLKKAILSVLNQTFPHFRVQVYDNASGDETEEVVKELAKEDPRIIYYCHPENIGAPENFQYGLKNIETPYFSILSDDDYLLSEFYETVLKGFEEFPDIMFSSGTVVGIKDTGEVNHIETLSWPDKKYYSPPEGLFEMVGKHLNWTAILFSKKVFSEIGFLNTDIKALDVDFLFRITARFPYAVTKKNCALFVSHSSSYSTIVRLKLVWPGWAKMIENLKKDDKIPTSVLDKAEKLIREDLRKRLIVTALEFFKLKKFEDAQEALHVLKEQFQLKPKESFILCFVNWSQKSSIIFNFFMLLLLSRKRLKDALNFNKKLQINTSNLIQ